MLSWILNFISCLWLYLPNNLEKKSYTFNCHKDNIEKSLTSDVYVFIQIVEGYAYIEQLRNREYVKQNVMQSIFKNSMCYVNAERLLQHTLKI